MIMLNGLGRSSGATLLGDSTLPIIGTVGTLTSFLFVALAAVGAVTTGKYAYAKAKPMLKRMKR